MRDICVPFHLHRRAMELTGEIEIIPNVELRFFPVTKIQEDTIYRCMDCAFSNLEWSGFEYQIQEHADSHKRMAQWYETRILPLLNRSKQ